MAEHRALAEAAQDRPVSRGAAAVIVAVWIAAMALLSWWVWKSSIKSFIAFSRNS
jgi:ABC-type uncharacterized transport system permease subunit